jgi:hypothetical protein
MRRRLIQCSKVFNAEECPVMTINFP